MSTPTLTRISAVTRFQPASSEERIDPVPRTRLLHKTVVLLLVLGPFVATSIAVQQLWVRTGFRRPAESPSMVAGRRQA